MPRFTTSLDSAMYETIRTRAAHNLRSMSSEITYLLECALASELGADQGLIRTLMMMQRNEPDVSR